MPNYGLAMPGRVPFTRSGPSTRIYEEDDTFAGKSGVGHQNLRVRFEDEYGEDTENVEYTTEIRAARRNAAPRRRKTTENRQMKIHEDIGKGIPNHYPSLCLAQWYLIGPVMARPTVLPQTRRSSLKITD